MFKGFPMTQSPPKPSESPDSQEVSQSPSHEEQEAKSQPRRKLPLLIAGGLLAVAGAGAAAWYFLSRPDSEVLALSGRIEGYPTDIDAKAPGRIESVAVREGDRVQVGQVVAQLEDDEIQAQLQGATARLNAAKQQQHQALLQIGIVESQIQEVQLNRQQAGGEAEGRILQAQANVAAAEAQETQAAAQLNQARAERQLSRTDRDRYAQLRRDGAVSQQRLDQAQTAFETAQATVNSRQAAVAAAQRQVSAARGALTQAQSTGLNPEIRSAQLAGLTKQRQVAQAQLAAAQEEVTNAEAGRQQILAQMAYLNLASPISGVVITRTVEPGTVVTAGKTLLTVLDPNQVYLRGFMPEGEIGNVRVGQAARVYLDSAPDRPLKATVSAVDTQASFTPENIYFREDRVRQVFGVDLRIQDPQGFAKPGMPADAEILPVEARDQ